MFPKGKKLSSGEIEQLVKQGKRMSSAWFKLIFLPQDQGGSKWAVQTPVRLVKPANQRNRSKRIIFQALRQLQINEKQPFWIMVRLNQPIAELKTAQVVDLLRPLLVKAGII